MSEPHRDPSPDPAPDALRRRVADAIPPGVARGVGRIVPAGVDPESIPLPEPTPLSAGPNARPPDWDRETFGD